MSSSSFRSFACLALFVSPLSTASFSRCSTSSVVWYDCSDASRRASSSFTLTPALSAATRRVDGSTVGREEEKMLLPVTRRGAGPRAMRPEHPASSSMAVIGEVQLRANRCWQYSGTLSMVPRPLSGVATVARATCLMALLALAKGARIARLAGHANTLLLEQGRAGIAAAHATKIAGGAAAVVTDVDVTVGALDADNFFEDTTRPNDITYYEVGKGTKEGGYALQNKGFKFCIPRVGVSPGEKLEFSALLAQLSVRAAASARDEAGGMALVGASVRYQAEALEGYDTPSAAVFYPLGQERDQIHLGDEGRAGAAVAVGLTHQLATAARENVDFFAVEGCATADDVGRLGALFESYPETKVKSRVTDTRGFDHDGEEITAGFGAP